MVSDLASLAGTSRVGGSMSTSPKSISVSLMGGGFANNFSRWARSSSSTAPEIFRDGPSESMRALSVIRFVS